MKRYLLILTCAAVLAASGGCRSCGSWFNFGGRNNDACCEGGVVGPGVTSYSPDISGYDDGSYLEGPIDGGGSSIMMSPPENVLPAPAR